MKPTVQRGQRYVRNILRSICATNRPHSGARGTAPQPFRLQPGLNLVAHGGATMLLFMVIVRTGGPTGHVLRL